MGFLAALMVVLALDGYAGSAACRSCHLEQYTAWKGSNHERAMQVAAAETVRGDFGGVDFADRGTAYRFFRRDGRFLVRTLGADGKEKDFEVRYTFGVEPLQQYLVEMPGGRLQALTIAWDTRPKQQGGQRWFALNPEEAIPPGDPFHWTGSEFTWNYQCAACHSTNLRKGYDAEADIYATTWSEVNVACEACHGTGAAHVAWAEAAAAGTPTTVTDKGLMVKTGSRAGVDWAIDPKTGSARPQPGGPARGEVESCAPCHARRTAIAAEWLPGQPLLDAWVPMLLAPGLYHADGQIEGEVYEYGSFVQSRMYHSGVACTDCHEPHGLALRAPGDQVCARCHASATFAARSHHFHQPGSSGASCIACHMPVETYMVIDPRHDHGLRVPRPDLSVAIGTPNACNACHGDRDSAWAAARVREWYGRDAKGYQAFAPALHAGRSGSIDAPRRLAALVRDAEQPAIARATALAELRRFPGPQALGAVRLGVADVDPLVRRAALTALDSMPLAERVPLATPLLADPVRGVRIEAARLLAAVPLQSVPAEIRPRLEDGWREWMAAQRIDADRPEARVNLGTFHAERGDAGAAESELRQAIRMRPDFIPAYVNLADVLRASGRDADGERVLRQGLAASPADADLRHALGLLLVRRGRNDAALVELEKAAGLRPEEARYAYVLGIALNSTGDSARALAALAAAHERHPGDREILWALATISRDAGRSAEAAGHAAKLLQLDPDDPAARRLAAEIGAQPE